MKHLFYAIEGKQSGILCESSSLKEAYNNLRKAGEPGERCVGWMFFSEADADGLPLRFRRPLQTVRSI